MAIARVPHGTRLESEGGLALQASQPGAGTSAFLPPQPTSRSAQETGTLIEARAYCDDGAASRANFAYDLDEPAKTQHE